jgi:hypothetical protein
MDIIDEFIDENKQFVFSKTESRLEYYKCFHDSSSEKLISGEELLKLKDDNDWSKEKYSIWIYFYRAYKYGDILGKKQNEKIEKKQNKIKQLSSRKDNYFFIKNFFFFLSLLLFILPEIDISSTIPVLVFLIGCYFYIQGDLLNNKIAIIKKEIRTLDREKKYLLDQVDEMRDLRKSSSDINALFWKDIRTLEQEYAKKLFPEKYSEIKENTKEFYKSIKQVFNEKNEHPIFPVIPSWALLQQSETINPNTHKKQATGIKIAEKDIKEKIATWRKSINEKPIFRLWYIQFLFFHDKNLTIQSFYYDFITKKKYGERLEIYQYNHITNYSYIDEDINYMIEDPLMLKMNIPPQLTNNIFCDQVKTLSFSSASGAHYRCVIPDNDVMKGLNKWIKYKNEIREEELKREGKISSGEFNDEEIAKILSDEKNKISNINDEYESLISTLAWQSFKELGSKVAQFALLDKKFEE